MWFVVRLFFFFKQKTAYEMRISDWSSDVCSSDLDRAGEPALAVVGLIHLEVDADRRAVVLADPVDLLRRGAALVFGHGARIEDRQADALLVQLVIDVVVEIGAEQRSEEHTSELQSLMRISYAVFCLKKKIIKH